MSGGSMRWSSTLTRTKSSWFMMLLQWSARSAPNEHAGTGTCIVQKGLAVNPDRRAVDEHMQHSFRFGGDDSLAVGREVSATGQRAWADRVRIEDHDVSGATGAEHAAPAETEHRRG